MKMINFFLLSLFYFESNTFFSSFAITYKNCVNRLGGSSQGISGGRSTKAKKTNIKLSDKLKNAKYFVIHKKMDIH